VAANCNGNATAVVPGLGVCLSDLVSVPQASGTSAPIPLPTITGIDTPVSNTGGRRRLAWWEILLMTLGCVLIFLCVLALFRRRMRAKRAKRTAEFAAAKNIDSRGAGWRARLRSLFSRRSRVPKEEKVALRVAQLRNVEEERHRAAMGKLGASEYVRQSRRLSAAGGDVDSFYSQVTGLPPRAPVPRQPVRYSGATVRSSSASSISISEAQRYARSVDQLTPAATGTSEGSRNPFRK